MKFFSALLLVICFLSNHGIAYASEEHQLILSTDDVNEVIQRTASEFEQAYLFPDKAALVVSALNEASRRGEFDQQFAFDRLKHKLESLVIQASGDSNFELLRRHSNILPDGQDQPIQSSSIDSEMLTDTIGYLKFQGDLLQDNAHTEAYKAIEYLANAHAIIIDLTEVGMGSIELSHSLLSHFVAAGTQLGNVQFSTDPPQPLVSLENSDTVQVHQNVQVYVLTSSFVAGPWEWFAYTLQHLERASIVGEETMGLGVMTTLVPVNQHAMIAFSYAEISFPGPSVNWDRWGVEADYQTTAEASLDTAFALAKGNYQAN